jgi:hypothetical protein
LTPLPKDEKRSLTSGLAEEVALELEAMGIMDDAVEDGVGAGGIAEHGAIPQ